MVCVPGQIMGTLVDVGLPFGVVGFWLCFVFCPLWTCTIFWICMTCSCGCVETMDVKSVLNLM